MLHERAEAGGAETKKQAKPSVRQPSSRTNTAASAAAIITVAGALSIADAFSVPLLWQPPPPPADHHAASTAFRDSRGDPVLGRKATSNGGSSRSGSSLLPPHERPASSPSLLSSRYSSLSASARPSSRWQPRRVVPPGYHQKELAAAAAEISACSSNASASARKDSKSCKDDRTATVISPCLPLDGVGIATGHNATGREEKVPKWQNSKQQRPREKAETVTASSAARSAQGKLLDPSTAIPNTAKGELSIDPNGGNGCCNRSTNSGTGPERQPQDSLSGSGDDDDLRHGSGRQHQHQWWRESSPASEEYEFFSEEDSRVDGGNLSRNDSDDKGGHDWGAVGRTSSIVGIRRTGLTDNDARMFLLERGLSQSELRRVLSVMRRDPEVISNVDILATRMQALAGILEGVSTRMSWHTLPNETTSAEGNSAEPEDTAAAAAVLVWNPDNDVTVDKSRTTVHSRVLSDATVGGRMDSNTIKRHTRTAAVAREEEEDRGREGVVNMLLGGGVDRGGIRGEGYARDEVERVQNGSRILAYQMVAREPRLLLLLKDATTVASRVHSLLDLFPYLGRGDSARLRKAACLLLQPRDMIEGKMVDIAKLLPREVDVRDVLCKVPSLLRHSEFDIALSLRAVETLIPGVRVDRLLRSSPQLLVQPAMMVQRRLTALRAVLNLPLTPQEEKGGEKTRSSGGRERNSGKSARTLARFANAFPQILDMNPRSVRDKIADYESLLPELSGLALVTSEPRLLGFDVMGNIYTKMYKLRALLEPKTDGDLATAISRCPSLLAMSSVTLRAKLGKLQDALPSGLDARKLVSKDPRLLSLDMDSAVPRKIGQLARVFSVHAEANGEETADIMAQVLTYRPGTLLYDPATLDSKLAALGNAGVPAGTLRSVVRDAPRCLSVGTNALVSRVSALTEAFPTVPLRRLLGDAPGLLVKKIDLVGQERLLRELFPTVDPARLVHGAPILLALSEKALTIKRDAWRLILEPRIDAAWEKAVAQFPQFLCQGLGRGARIMFLQNISGNNSSVMISTSPSGEEGAESGSSIAMAMDLSEAFRIVRMTVADFAKDYPAYPAFVNSLLVAAPGPTNTAGMGSNIGVEPVATAAAAVHVSGVHHTPTATGRSSGTSTRSDCSGCNDDDHSYSKRMESAVPASNRVVGGLQQAAVAAVAQVSAPGLLGSGVGAMGEKDLGASMMAVARESGVEAAVDILTTTVENV